jgi:hypothetical protein
MKTASAKSKGRRLQQLVARRVAELTGLECGPDCPIESRQMGQTGPDVRLDSEARKQFPFTVECKNQETWSVSAWVEQVKKNRYPETDWLLVVGKNRYKHPIVVMELEVFFDLLERLR